MSVLTVLHLEDDSDYAELVKGMLAQQGLQARIMLVENLADFTRALEKEKFDLILADYSLPSCTGLQALEAARRQSSDIPFLLVSGAIGEQAAIDSLKNGATDYVLKQWPERLIPAVRRALQLAEERAQRKRAEEELVRRERYFRALTENSQDVLTILDRDGALRYTSPSLKRVLGYEPQELVGRNAFELVHPVDAPAARQAFAEVLQNPDRTITHEFRFRRRDGTWCWLETVGRDRRDDPAIAGLVLNARDVSERKRAEAQMRLQSTALESTANGIVITDRTGTVLWVNPAFTALTGYSAQEIVGQNPRLLKSGKQDQAFYKELWETILAGRVWRSELVNRRKDGSLFTEYSTITPLRDEGGEISHFIAVKQDITERKQLEADLRQAQKMEAVGQLAGGVAHDFNNLLTVIRGNAELVLMQEGLRAEATGCLKHVVAAAERAARLTQQLLLFSRKQVMQSQPLRLNEVIANLTKMLKRVIREDIILECRYAEPLPMVHADGGMLEQAILNLVVNARDAMPRGGHLLLATEKLCLDETAARNHPEARVGEYVCLGVKDTGIGIAPENLHRIFDPFFTTKEPGKGTGLGLATVYGIVKQHAGWVEVSSQLGAGTSFRIYLPALAVKIKAEAAVPGEAGLRGGTETILLVEDDDSVRLITQRVLERFSYRVYAATCAREALGLWATHKAEVALLLTDVVMPDGMSGWELVEQLRERKPGLKVVVMSGYSPEVTGKDTTSIGRSNTSFLQKPCPAQELIQTVRRCLDGK
jgi:two-component system, cell cycle sensor histidine kinase and response regulator CckA